MEKRVHEELYSELIVFDHDVDLQLASFRPLGRADAAIRTVRTSKIGGLCGKLARTNAGSCGFDGGAGSIDHPFVWLGRPDDQT